MKNLTIEETKRKFINDLSQECNSCQNKNELISHNNINSISSDIKTDIKIFIAELIKNSDESSFQYTDCLKIRITFKDNMIVFSHNGKALDRDDIKSLCTSQTSSWENKFMFIKEGRPLSHYAHKIIIYSDDYNFRFDKAGFNLTQNNLSLISENKIIIDQKKWQTIPIWTEETEIDGFIQSTIKDWNVNYIIFFDKPFNDELKSYLLDTQSYINDFIFLKSHHVELGIYEESEQLKRLTKSFYEGDDSIITLTDGTIENYFYGYEEQIPLQGLCEDVNQLCCDLSLPVIYRDRSFKLPISLKAQLNKSDEGFFIIKQIPSDKRLLYASVPTNINYKFPFLIYSLFALDSHSRLKEDYWNKAIFKLIPRVLSVFQQKVFRRFGNTFALILPIDVDIKCESLNEAFRNELEIISQKERNEIIINTKKSLQHPESCYFENFEIGNYGTLDSCFKSIYSGVATRILKDFLFTQNITFSLENEIVYKDQIFIKRLADYYGFKIPTIDNNVFFDYLNSNIYQRNYSHKYAHFIVEKLKETPCFAKLRDTSFLLNNKQEFKKPSELFMKAENMQEEHFYQDSNNLIDENLYIIFKNENSLSLLENLGVREKIINYEKLLCKESLDNYYKKESSIGIVKAIFMKWVNGNKDAKKGFVNLLSKRYLLSESNKFCYSHNMLIGHSYTGKNTWETYYDYNVSHKYYIEGTNKSDWIEFFHKLELTSENEPVLIYCDKESFVDNPLLAQKFKDQIINKRIFSQKVKDVSFWAIPFAEKTYKENIFKFFTDFIEFIKPPEEDKNNTFTFVNYVKWLIETEMLVPTFKKTNLKYTELYSHDVLENKPKEIKNIFKNVLDFALNKDIWKCLSGAKLKFKTLDDLNLINAQEILQGIHNTACEGDVLNGGKAGDCKYWFFDIMLKLSQKQNAIYEGSFLSEDDQFLKREDLFYINDEYITTIFEDKFILQGKSKLKLPPKLNNEKQFKQFLNFCRDSKIKIYDNDELSFTPVNPQKENSLESKANEIIEIIKDHCGNNKQKTNKLKNLRFYSVSSINLKSYDEDFSHVICYYDRIEKIIYYLNDDVYKNWKPSFNIILYCPNSNYYFEHQRQASSFHYSTGIR
jgi:hypothetical protein